MLDGHDSIVTCVLEVIDRDAKCSNGVDIAICACIHAV